MVPSPGSSQAGPESVHPSDRTVQLITHLARKFLPEPMLRVARRARQTVWNMKHGRGPEVAWEDDFPWCSPDVWSRIVESYMKRPRPWVCEYGTGVSTLHHIRNLLKVEGTFIGIEHNPDWYDKLVARVISYCARHGLRLTSEVSFVLTDGRSGGASSGVDTVMTISDGAGLRCTVKLRLRPTSGTGYVEAFDEPCDAVLIDGKRRKACVRHVLDSGLVKTGGLIVLLEAWRGMDEVDGRPTLTGKFDYRPEVRRMQALGGELVDGAGFDQWPGLVRRRTIGAEAFSSPAEAFFLTVGNEKP